MKVKKKPVVIDAIEWTGNNIVEIGAFSDGKATLNAESGTLEVVTNEGTMQAKVGDMILKAQSASIGEHVWPVDGGYFIENYDVIEE